MKKIIKCRNQEKVTRRKTKKKKKTTKKKMPRNVGEIKWQGNDKVTPHHK